METLFENILPLLILFLVVGWWILRGVFRVIRRSVVGMDEVVEVGRLAMDDSRSPPSAPVTTRPRAPVSPLTARGDHNPRPAPVVERPAAQSPSAPDLEDLPSIDDLARVNRQARDQMREDMHTAAGAVAGQVGDVGSEEIVYPAGTEEMLAEAWANIYGTGGDSGGR